MIFAVWGLGWLFFGIVTAIGVGKLLKAQQLHCPACESTEYTLLFMVDTKRVKRTCVTCGCTVTQPPSYPDLFKDK